ncbi:ROK family protein [Thermospira aquatica]|uniref:Glucokinase n=1 Tax=Thermospira aquatica TaxID=2828656 RepID=A0AAX3BBK9_9SPIR|nr:ROK family glucokinase [Thermospira aquatica]URA09521.1 ROK family glucokinase [Thermospira aquatica]
MEVFLGIDMGGTAIKLGLVSREGKLLKSFQVPTRAETQDRQVIVDNIKNAIRSALGGWEKVLAIGIGVPGGVDKKHGIIRFMPNIQALENYSLAEDLEKSFGMPVAIDNDANNAARGEYVFGAAKKYQDFVLITLGTGIGGGIFIRGDIYGGVANFAGEVGHMKLVPEGRTCGCGLNGCWEAYGSATAMIKRAQGLVAMGKKTSLSSVPEINAKVIFDEAKKGDEIALEVVEEVCHYLGIGIANLIHLFNPEAVVVGGGVSQAGDFLFERLRRYTSLYTKTEMFETCTIVPAALVNDAGVMGSAALAIMTLEHWGK